MRFVFHPKTQIILMPSGLCKIMYQNKLHTAMGKRCSARRLAMQALYRWHLNAANEEEIASQMEEEHDFSRVDKGHFARLLKAGTQDKYTWRIDLACKEESEPMGALLLAIISNAVCEIYECEDIDVAVSISEAVKLARKFGGNDSYQFVNAVLEKLVEDKRTSKISEDQFIAEFLSFKQESPAIVRGIGDDAAIIQSQSTKNVVAVDTIVAGNHFSEFANPEGIGYKSLAVNLSDFGAMGATPRWATVALSLPQADRHWLKGFVRGFRALADEYEVALIGGDTTKGAMVVTVQLMGDLDGGKALLRSGATPGQGIFVSGEIGKVGLHLTFAERMKSHTPQLAKICNTAVLYPTPRVRLGKYLAQHGATAGIDISDGILKDLSKLLISSQCGALVNIENIPVPNGLDIICLNLEDRMEVLRSGEDYELVFTMDEDLFLDACEYAREFGVPLHRIGTVEEGDELKVFHQGRKILLKESLGYDNFAK